MERDVSGVRIRLAVREDATAIASVLRESFAEYEPLYTREGFDATTPLSAQVGARIEEGPIWVALDGDAIVGTVSVVSKGESLYIRGMAIVPAARGRRIGELLLRRVEEFAYEHGFSRMFLSTTPFLARAIQLYERYGFKRTVEGPDNLFGTPLFTMEKILEPPDDLELLDVHARALFTHDERARLLSVNEPSGGRAPAPRIFFGRARTCNLWRFRADLPDALVEELEALCADEPVGLEFGSTLHHAEAYARLLEAHAHVRGTWAGPAYRFAEYVEPTRTLVRITEANAELLRGGFEDFADELPTWQPFVALLEEGRAASVCRSVRITHAAHEAGVETLPEFRGKGYAKEVTAGWARLVRSSGAMPLYSTSWENVASQAVAKKLRLTMYASDFQIT